MIQPTQPRNVGILIFPDVEILDFCGPFEVFASATVPAPTDGGLETRLFEVLLPSGPRSSRAAAVSSCSPITRSTIIRHSTSW